MNQQTVLGIDLGGTNVRGGLLKNNELIELNARRMHTQGSFEEVLRDLFRFTDSIMHASVKAIGIGVPGLVQAGMVYDLLNIPSWKEVPLQKLMEERYQVPVIINNDANCFALGEFFFGKGQGHNTMVGLTIGTGLGSGLIIDKKLHSGMHCGAGEFGMITYLDHCYEYYASGQFFQNVYNIDGETVFEQAKQGSSTALRMYQEMGMHLGNAIKTILYVTDVSLIVLGGSISKASDYFSGTMWERIRTFTFKKSIEHLQIEVSELPNSGVLGAAALCL